MKTLNALLRREVAHGWVRGGGPLLSIGFFAAVTVMLPLAEGPAPARLAAVATGLTWIALTLASLLSLDRLFESDLADGALDMLAMGPLPFEIIASVKCAAQWITVGAPLAVAAPVGALALGAPPDMAPIIFVVALIGGVAFAFLGGAGAALALASQRGGVLIALIVLPLLTPPVIFGGAALNNFAAGLPWAGGLTLLCAYTLATVALTPFAMAGACRNALA